MANQLSRLPFAALLCGIKEDAAYLYNILYNIVQV